MKLLLDMNLSPRWKLLLEAAGYEAVHWSTIGPGNASDIQIMALAKAGKYIVLLTTWIFPLFWPPPRERNPAWSKSGRLM
ncbi:DUF5615 family PIN-like protein [Deltaproteobacteria bacterium OttesenSCG-928-M10]|nr:DUF5615 family PIN-like protein [Deltaproteobacteria bacterium OttesenSCG-928-M10]